MSHIKGYNYEKYSILDIKNYLESLGYETEPFREGERSPKLHIAGTSVFVDFPEIYDGHKDKGFDAFADIRFENYPRTENYEKSQKLYQKLSRKFGKKSGLQLQSIKDWDKIQQFVRANF